MFRTTVNDVSLFGGRTTAGPKPSFRPAVEALEQRVVPAFTLTSNFPDGGAIPKEFAGPRAGGTNASPALVWRNVPGGTESFALIMYDMSATASDGGPVIHWVFFNLGKSVRSLVKAGSFAGGEQGLNWSGTRGYLGPEPPPGDNPPGDNPPSGHTYVFTLYALDTKLDLEGNVTAGRLSRAMGRDGGTNHILGRATLRGTFYEPEPPPPPAQ
jgi:Raf kinase inhibitor-like YbhB/YbcL family protein